MSLPYHSILIDSSPGRFSKAINLCLTSSKEDRPAATSNLEKFWTTPGNPGRVLPCLSVRSALDLYLQAQAYAPGSEVIMTAINIQDMAHIIHHHKLKVVPVDISINTLGPSQNDLEKLITDKTVAILVAHLFGRWVEMDHILAIAERYGLHVIEDCAESFCGFSRLGCARSDISLFSFGVIKFSTSFGGAIAKVRDDQIWEKMNAIQSTYPSQTNQMYLKKILKYMIIYIMFYTWPIPHAGQVFYHAGYDYKEFFLKYMRGFVQESLIDTIRHQPSPALLSMMLYTHMSFNQKEFSINRKKGDYFLSRLKGDMIPVGTDVKVNNHWLFPVLVKNAEETVKLLNDLDVCAYRGSTQLTLIEGDTTHATSTHSMSGTVSYVSSKNNTPESTNCTHLGNATCSGSAQSVVSNADFIAGSAQLAKEVHGGHLQVSEVTKNACHGTVQDKSVRLNPQFSDSISKNSSKSKSKSHHPTPEASYLMDHVIYLPVNRRVPYRDLDKIASICSRVVRDKGVSLPQSESGLTKDSSGKGLVLPTRGSSKL